MRCPFRCRIPSSMSSGTARATPSWARSRSRGCVSSTDFRRCRSTSSGWTSSSHRDLLPMSSTASSSCGPASGSGWTRPWLRAPSHWTSPTICGRTASRCGRTVKSSTRAGGKVTCEDLRSEAMLVFTEAGMILPDIVIVSHGAQTAVGHEPGYGEIQPGEPIVVDLYPQDPESGCYTDMSRTFCLGEPEEELVRYHALVREALELAYEVIKPGVTGAEAHRAVCEFFQEHGFPTQLTKTPGQVLDEGFFHSLGHGVGLEVHEQPGLGRTGVEIVAGDVLAVEPGLYRKGFGGCRLEDIVLVTEDGGEVLTDF